MKAELEQTVRCDAASQEMPSPYVALCERCVKVWHFKACHVHLLGVSSLCVCVHLCSCWPSKWFLQPGGWCIPPWEGRAAAPELLLWARGRAKEFTRRPAGGLKTIHQSSRGVCCDNVFLELKPFCKITTVSLKGPVLCKCSSTAVS